MFFVSCHFDIWLQRFVLLDFPSAPTFPAYSSSDSSCCSSGPLLDLLGLLCVTVLLFSPDPQSRSTKDILCIGSAPVLTVCYCTNCKYLSFTSVELNYFSCIRSLDEKDIKACGLFLPPDLVSPFWLFGSPSGDYSCGQFSIPGFVHSPRKIPVVLQQFQKQNAVFYILHKTHNIIQFPCVLFECPKGHVLLGKLPRHR